MSSVEIESKNPQRVEKNALQEEQREQPPTQPAYQRSEEKTKSILQQWYAQLLTYWVRSGNSIKSIRAYPSNISLADGWGDGLPCSHTHRERDCIVYVFKGFLRGIAVGFSLKSAFSLTLSITSRQLFRKCVLCWLGF